MQYWIILFISLLSLNLYADSLQENSDDTPLNVSQVAEFNGIPWGITLLDDQFAIVTVKQGEAYKVNLNTGEKQALSNLPKVDSRGQGGLLDVAKSPDYQADKTTAENNWLYFTYSKQTEKGAATTLARAKLSGTQLVNWQDLLISDSASDTSKHYGGRITFDDQQHVFFSIGDRGVRQECARLT